jgi:hypothetical protein
MVIIDLDDAGKITTVEVLHRPDVEAEFSSALARMRNREHR